MISVYDMPRTIELETRVPSFLLSADLLRRSVLPGALAVAGHFSPPPIRFSQPPAIPLLPAAVAGVLDDLIDSGSQLTVMDSHRPSLSQRPSQAILHPNMDADYIIHPGPIDESVLNRQTTHRTEAIWKPELDTKNIANEPLKVHKGGTLKLDVRIRDYVVAVGFYPWTQVASVRLDPTLLTAAIERWRPETHTFHLNDGEATITLQDVSLLTGLPVEGMPVTGRSQINFEEVCERLLGVYPECDSKSPAIAKRSWFTDHLREIPADAGEEMLKMYARAYLLHLIGTTLFSDKSGNTIPLCFLPLLEDLDRIRDYSWGSAVLACLYSNMCSASQIGHRGLAGAPLIIQFWCWERLSRIGVPKITPTFELPPPEAEFDPALRGPWSLLNWLGPKKYKGVPHGSLLQYREALQKMQVGDFIWRPYDERMFEYLNPNCLEGRDTTWRADGPLICFNIIEWHHPGRVARQYGFLQGVPLNAIGCSDKCHGMDRKKNGDWGVFHASYIALWVSRHERLINGDMAYPGNQIDIPTSQYYAWYATHTRRLIQPRIEDEVEEVGEDDAHQTRPSHAYRPDTHIIPENIRALVMNARDAREFFLNCTDDYSRRGFHKIFHTAYTEIEKLTDPSIVGVDPNTVTLDAGDTVNDYGGGYDAEEGDDDDQEHMDVDDTHNEDQMDDRYRPSSSSQPVRHVSERERDPSRWSFIRRLPRMLPRRGRR
ncbi:hypothetical protein QQ045_024301 [Rhodiola kirilowii]